jgi:NAD(P)H-dependent FMN reductase
MIIAFCILKITTDRLSRVMNSMNGRKAAEELYKQSFRLTTDCIMKEKILIGGISGSLRTNSVNTHVLNHLGRICGPDIALSQFTDIDKLPFFNPDKDTQLPIESVSSLNSFIESADVVIFCTPEYAFGVPGVLKNALDWLVSSGVIYQKPVGTISASPGPGGGDKAHMFLRLTLSAWEVYP